MRTFTNPQIDKGVPIPTVPRRQWLEKRKVPVSPWVAWVEQLEVGDSFEVDWFNRNTIIRYMKRAGMDFASQQIIDRRNWYRIWRKA